MLSSLVFLFTVIFKAHNDFVSANKVCNDLFLSVFFSSTTKFALIFTRSFFRFLKKIKEEEWVQNKVVIYIQLGQLLYQE